MRKEIRDKEEDAREINKDKGGQRKCIDIRC